MSLTDSISGVLGFGFPRLSRIYHTAVHGNDFALPGVTRSTFLRLLATGTPFFSSLAQQGIVDYPIFGIYLTRNYSGTLSLGQSINAAIRMAKRLSSHRCHRLERREQHQRHRMALRRSFCARRRLQQRVQLSILDARVVLNFCVPLCSCCLNSLLTGSIQVNGTGITPVPTYPSVTPGVGSLALLDMYVPPAFR